MKKSLTAHGALLATNIFFAINYSAVKYLFNNNFIRPFGLNLLRASFCASVLWSMFLFRRNKTPVKRKHLPRFFLCAFTGIAVNQLLFIKGLSLTYSIHASLLMLGTPILITIIAAIVLRERLNAFKIAGLAFGVGGALILIAAGNAGGNAADVMLGDILIILNAFSYAFYFILVKPLMKEYDPLVILRVIFSMGAIMMIPFCLKEFKNIPWQAMAAKEYAVLALILIGGTLLAYLFNVYGIKILGASIAGAYIYTQPLFAAAIAIVFLKEEISGYKIAAALLIFIGVWLSNKSKKDDGHSAG